MAEMIVIFVGDVTEELANIAKATDSVATLITKENANNLKPGTYYVSRGDLNSESELFEILTQADSIVYSPPAIWSDTDSNHVSQMQQITENILVFLSTTKKIKNFQTAKDNNLNNWVELVDQRKSPHPQLWSVGCSVTAGVGVDTDERYGQLIANTVKLPVSFLAKSGSSVIWQADQILRSDICKDDLIIWGIVSLSRFPYYVNNNLMHVNITQYSRNQNNIQKYIDLSVFDSQDLLYRTITDVYKVINFCNKVGATLIITDLFGNNLQKYFQDFKNIVHAYWTPWNSVSSEQGSDGSHPGASVHRYYHDTIIKKLTEI